ncbi:uncharacterized protein LOC119089922 [Pollicipes pollicipes]|uniref:uncharacterized protein LOC119089922 n=1 Tax=Pollicipes pollicipes TaxID=41117 RepID=UPI00188570F2|nr:uncharacterized protein LOC119089922 [Pollicipes pollicipes]
MSSIDAMLFKSPKHVKKQRFQPFIIKKGIVMRAKQRQKIALELSKSKNDSTMYKDPKLIKLKSNNRSLSRALTEQKIENKCLFDEKIQLQKEVLGKHEVIMALRNEVQAHDEDLTRINDVFRGSLQLLLTLTEQLNVGLQRCVASRRRSKSVSMGTGGARSSRSSSLASGLVAPGTDGVLLSSLPNGSAGPSKKLHKVLPTVAGNVISHPSIVLPRLPTSSGWFAPPSAPGARRVPSSEDTDDEEEPEEEPEPTPLQDSGGRLPLATPLADLSVILEQSLLEPDGLSPLREALVVVPAEERLSGDEAWRRHGRRAAPGLDTSVVVSRRTAARNADESILATWLTSSPGLNESSVVARKTASPDADESIIVSRKAVVVGKAIIPQKVVSPGADQSVVSRRASVPSADESIIISRKTRRAGDRTKTALEPATEPDAEPDESVVITRRTQGRRGRRSADPDRSVVISRRTRTSCGVQEPLPEPPAAPPAATAERAAAGDDEASPSPEISVKQRYRHLLAQKAPRACTQQRVAATSLDDPLEGPSHRVWLPATTAGQRPSPVADTKLATPPTQEEPSEAVVEVQPEWSEAAAPPDAREAPVGPGGDAESGTDDSLEQTAGGRRRRQQISYREPNLHK